MNVSFGGRRLAIVVAGVVIDSPNCGATHAMFVCVLFFQSRGTLIVKTHPLVVPGSLHYVGASIYQGGRQASFLDNAFYLTTTQHTSLVRAPSCFAWSAESTAYLGAAMVSNRITPTIVGKAKSELSGINASCPQSF